eukprot:4689001-Ditylum_brightwellii.AAC.2
MDTTLMVVTISNVSKLKMHLRMQPNTMNSITPHLIPVKVGSVKHATITSLEEGVADSGATVHMMNSRDYFVTYTPTPGAYVVLADKTTISTPGPKLHLHPSSDDATLLHLPPLQ